MSEWAPSVGGGATTGRSQLTPSAQSDTEAHAAQLIRRIVQSAQDRDPRALRAKLDVAAAVLGIDRCVDEIVIPAAREVHRLLAPSQPVQARDLMAIEAIRAWLNDRGLFAPPPREIGPILLACGPRDRYVVGLESLALLLRVQRWPCRVLGARTSTFTLTIAAQAADATAVVIMCTDGRGLPHAVVSILAVDALGVPVFFAGEAFETRHSQHQLPGQYLGTSVSGGSALLCASLAAAAHRSSAAKDGLGPQDR